METALKAAGGNVRYREYPGVEHDCWTQTYADHDVLKWMFEQRRAKGEKK
jgi:acetyl esterase/lipase